MKSVVVGEGKLTLDELLEVVRGDAKVEISNEALEKMKKSRQMVDECVAQKRVVYGLTTGFGKFSDVSISEEDSKELQVNLIMSHSCGVGKPLDREIVRAMMLLRINALSVGFSGIRPQTVKTLVEMLNKGVTPIVLEKGSVGASGDLVPLSHMTLVLLGMGEAEYEGVRMTGKEAMEKAGIKPVELTSKEGLALINGTQAMCAIGSLAVLDSEIINKTADIIASLSLESDFGVIDAMDERLHILRGQPGQIKTAKNIRRILEGSKGVTHQGEKRVQDAYSFRCIPQIHGPSHEFSKFVREIIERELNAVTDNPIIFPETNQAISGGNFHGQYLAMGLDVLGIALAELADVSERRIERLVNPALSGLPAFLVKQGGLNSGLMISQYTAAAMVSENKVLAHPACVDSIPTSANQEDHVSMGMTSARKAREILFNTTNVLAIELLTACQAVEFTGEDKLAPATKAVYKKVREVVPPLDKDRILYGDMANVAELIRKGEILRVAQEVIGPLE